MKKFEYQIEKVTGHCSCGYKVGDVFQCEGMNTPVLHFVEVLTWLCFLFKSPYTMELKGNLACPDNGYVVFKVTLIED